MEMKILQEVKNPDQGLSKLEEKQGQKTPAGLTDFQSLLCGLNVSPTNTYVEILIPKDDGIKYSLWVMLEPCGESSCMGLVS